MTILKDHKKILYRDDDFIIGIRDSNNWVIMDTKKYEKHGWNTKATFGYYGSLELALGSFIHLTIYKHIPAEPFNNLMGVYTWYKKTISQAIKKHFPKIEVN